MSLVYPVLANVSILSIAEFASNLPSKPEDTNGKGNTTSHDVRQTPFGNRNAIVGSKLANVPRLLSNGCSTSDELTNNHTEEAKTGLTRAEAVNANKDKRVGSKEKVEESIDETHVDGKQKNDGLSKEQTQRSRKVLLDELLEVNFDFLLLGMNTPVLSATSQISRLGD